MIKALRGTQDILPAEVGKWQYVERVMRDICERYGYQEIRTPHFEKTELFQRGIGTTTDVVTKEMYTFTDRGDRSLTLRPENTASVVRAYLEHKLYADQTVERLYYMGAMFRYDRPQAGRYREFRQFGIEVLGTSSPQADAEIISFAVHLFEELGLRNLKVYINSVGCPNCRPLYREKLLAFFADKKETLCNDCQNRLEMNPLRVLDCKQEGCRNASEGAPSIMDTLCDECRIHFTQTRELLEAIGIEYELNPRLVRGLDYYTKTAFEIQYEPLGAQSAICGGGRYDGLIEEIGGPSIPGIGFALGMERLLLALEMQNLYPDLRRTADAAIVTHGPVAAVAGFTLAESLRAEGFFIDTDLQGRSMKSRLKQAAKSGIKYVIIIGEDELRQGTVTIRDLTAGEQKKVAADNIAAWIKNESNRKG